MTLALQAMYRSMIERIMLQLQAEKKNTQKSKKTWAKTKI